MERVYQYYRRPGHLFPYDVRYDPSDVAFCERRADGSIRFRLITEPGFTEAVIARLDGSGTTMSRYAEDRRFVYWEATVDPAGSTFEYSFALRFGRDQPVYLVPSGITNAAERLDFWSLDVAHTQHVEVPQWARGAVIYQIFPDRFASGDSTLTPPDADPWGSPPHSRRFQGGDLRGIAQKADYLADLRIDAVYLNPVFRSLSVHRYDAVDYYEVDQRLGGNAALTEMVEALHARDIKVILDASFNHCHPHFFAFQDMIANGPASEYWDWFDVHSYPLTVQIRPRAARELYGERAEYFLDYQVNTIKAAGLTLVESEDDGPPVEPSYASWYRVPTMPRLVLTNPATRQYFLEVATHWITGFDIDGWRMDVARYIDHDFWGDFRRAVKSVDPDTYLIAEIMGDAMPWLQGDRFDATMNYQFRELAVDFFAEPTIDAVRFVDGLIRMQARYAPEIVLASQNLIGSHDTERFLTMAGGDARRLSLAAFTQMTVPGAPGLYYGDEVGMTGGSDPGSRGAFPWHDAASWNRDLLTQAGNLGRLRRDHPALRNGTFEVVYLDRDAFAFTRTNADERLLIIVNRADEALNCFIPVTTGRVDVLYGAGEVSSEPLDLRVAGVPPWSGLIASF